MMRALALLLALAAAAPLHAEPVMGRLFSTPAERAALEARRSAAAGGVVPAPESSAAAPTGVPADPNAAPAAPAAPPPAETLVLNGVLRSSSGRSTIWLNDQPQRAGQATYARPARNGKGMTVTLPSGQRILLKPGQRYDLNEGKVKDVNEP
ncbi:MAG: hypothetical protein V4641_22490 [Pseudomonadota bacterium]|jgi:hypothetical protein